MSLSTEALTRVLITAAADDATFLSLPFVAALQQCTDCAYAAALRNLTDATKPAAVGGDAVADCIARVRLETERRVAGQQRTALLLEQHTMQCASERERRRHPTVDIGVDAPPAIAAATVQPTAAAAATTLGRRRASSGPAGKSSRRASRRASSAAGSHTSNHISGGGGAGGGGRRGSREAAQDAAGLSSSTSTPLTTAAAVRLLREGLVRAFGWSVPVAAADAAKAWSRADGGSVAAVTGLADAVLSRRTYTPAASGTAGAVSVPFASQEGAEGGAASFMSPTGPTIPLYMELDDDEGQLDVVREWVEDVLIFALHHGFNTPQTQAVLLDSVLLLRVVEETNRTPLTSEAAWEERVVEALQEVLCTQTCPTATRVMERVRQRQPVVREVPDPMQLAEIEQRRPKATTAKALAALEAAQAAVPLVTQTLMEEVETEVERDATLPALFTMAEAAAVVEFLTRSAVMHRQLWRLMLGGSPAPLAPAVAATAAPAAATAKGGVVAARPARPVVQVPLCAYVEDVPPVFLPPLSAFYPARLQGEVDAQQALYRDCAAGKERLYAVKFAAPLGAMAAEEGGQRTALTTAATIAAAADRDAALTVAECAHVEHAFQLRMRDTIEQNAHVARSTNGPLTSSNAPEGVAERPAPPAAVSGNGVAATRVSVADAVARKSKASVSAHAAAKKGSRSASHPMTHSLVSADVAAVMPLPSDAAFSLAEVERRVERVAAAVDNMPSASATGAAGRGGPRKR